VLGILRGDAQRALLTATADADRRMRPLRPLRLVAGVVELIEPAVEARRVVAQQAGENRARLLEAVEALLDGAELDSIGAGFLLIPAGPDAELEASPRDDVQRGGHIRQHRGVTVVNAGYQRAQPQPRGGLRQGRQRGPSLQAWSRRIGEDRIEVIEGPSRLEDVDIVGGLPDREHVGPRGVLRGCFECESHVFPN
jgi:hypothetical protein